MATPDDEATYALDPETVGVLERVARRWGVSKSEALRRAIHASEAGAETQATRREEEADPRLAAFHRLVAMANLDAVTANAWIADIRAEREASSERIRHRWDEAEAPRGAGDR